MCCEHIIFFLKIIRYLFKLSHLVRQRSVRKKYKGCWLNENPTHHIQTRIHRYVLIHQFCWVDEGWGKPCSLWKQTFSSLGTFNICKLSGLRMNFIHPISVLVCRYETSMDPILKVHRLSWPKWHAYTRHTVFKYWADPRSKKLGYHFREKVPESELMVWATPDLAAFKFCLFRVPFPAIVSYLPVPPMKRQDPVPPTPIFPIPS